MFTLMTESDWEALRLTDEDLDRLLLRPCDLARYIDAQDGSDQPTGDAPRQPGQ